MHAVIPLAPKDDIRVLQREDSTLRAAMEQAANPMPGGLKGYIFCSGTSCIGMVETLIQASRQTN